MDGGEEGDGSLSKIPLTYTFPLSARFNVLEKRSKSSLSPCTIILMFFKINDNVCN